MQKKKNHGGGRKQRAVKAKKKPITHRWREEWLQTIAFANITEDGVAACVEAAIPERKLEKLLDDVIIDWLISAGITMSPATFDEEYGESGDSPMDYLLGYPDHFHRKAVMGEAIKFTAGQNKIFLAAFRKIPWALEDWEIYYRLDDEEDWDGVRDRLQSFQPEIVKKVIAHFLSLGLSAQEGRKAWKDYEKAKSGKG